MANLKHFIWGAFSESSKKTRFANKSFDLKQWPDFGLAECPLEFITLSAILMKNRQSYAAINSNDNVKLSKDLVNHYLYVCNLLQIVNIYEYENTAKFNLKSSRFLLSLKNMFGYKTDEK